MNESFKRVGSWLIAVFITAVLGIFLQTQNVVARLNDIGGDIGFGDRLSMTAYDIFYLGKPYFLFVGIALTFAFAAAGLIYRIAKFARPFIYIIAGAVALFVMLWAMKEVFFKIPAIAGARDGFGIAMQISAGALGGYIYAKLNPISADKNLDA